MHRTLGQEFWPSHRVAINEGEVVWPVATAKEPTGKGKLITIAHLDDQIIAYLGEVGKIRKADTRAKGHGIHPAVISIDNNVHSVARIKQVGIVTNATVK